MDCRRGVVTNDPGEDRILSQVIESAAGKGIELHKVFKVRDLPALPLFLQLGLLEHFLGRARVNVYKGRLAQIREPFEHLLAGLFRPKVQEKVGLNMELGQGHLGVESHTQIRIIICPYVVLKKEL